MSYAGLTVPFIVLGVVVLAVAVGLRRPDRTWWAASGATLVALLVLTVVFDNVMIAADLFRFGEEHLSGAKLGRAPVEDLAWPLVAGLLLPSLALLLEPRPEPRLEPQRGPRR